MHGNSFKVNKGRNEKAQEDRTVHKFKVKYSINYRTEKGKTDCLTINTDNNTELCYILTEVLRYKDRIQYLEITQRQFKTPLL